MSQIPSAGTLAARRAHDRYPKCRVCGQSDVSGSHVDRCVEKKRYLDHSRGCGQEADVPQPTVDDLHAHVIGRCHNDYIAALVVQVVVDLGWRPVVGNDPARLWTRPTDPEEADRG